MNLPERLEWKGRMYRVPAEQELQAMFRNRLAEAPSGDIVEVDDPNSWLVLLGIVVDRGV